MSLTHEDVALLGRSFENLGDSIMRNRMFEERKAENQRDYDMKQKLLDERMSERNSDEQRHREGTVKVWATSGNQSLGWSGPLSGVDSFKKQAQAGSDQPVTFSAEAPETHPSELDLPGIGKMRFTSPDLMMQWKQTHAAELQKAQDEAENSQNTAWQRNKKAAEEYLRHADRLEITANIVEKRDPEMAKKIRQQAMDYRKLVGVTRDKTTDQSPEVTEKLDPRTGEVLERSRRFKEGSQPTQPSAPATSRYRIIR